MSWAARPYPSEFAVADVLPLPYRAKDAPWEKVSAGRRRLELFSNEKTGEHVWMEDWDAGARVEDTVSKGYVNCSDAIGPWLTRLCLSRGEETFVVRGAFTERVGDAKEIAHAPTTWIREPVSLGGTTRVRVAGVDGARLLMKSGHLQMEADAKAAKRPSEDTASSEKKDA